MARDEMTLKVNIETLLEGEPLELEFVKQAVREKIERESTQAIATGTREHKVTSSDVAEMFSYWCKEKGYKPYTLGTRMLESGEVAIEASVCR